MHTKGTSLTNDGLPVHYSFVAVFAVEELYYPHELKIKPLE